MFQFYRKGDTKDSSGVSGDIQRKNILNSYAIICEIFSLNNNYIFQDKISSLLSWFDLIKLSIYFLSYTACIIFLKNKLFYSALLICFIFDFIHIYGNIIIQLVFISFIFTGNLISAVCFYIFNLFYLLLYPNYIHRFSKIILTILLIMFSIISSILWLESININLYLIFIIFLSLGSFLWRWVIGVHDRIMPLILPILLITTYVENSQTAHYVIMINIVISFFFQLFLVAFFFKNKIIYIERLC